MVKRTTLAATALSAAAFMGLAAQTAMAGTVAVDRDATTGVTRLLFGESRVSANDPLDPTKTVAVSEINTIKVTRTGDFFVVNDSTTPLTFRGTESGSGCSNIDANTVRCTATNVQQLNFPLGLNNDSFDNQTDTPTLVMGGPGTDRIINSGAGDDTIEVSGSEIDDVLSCGAGVDHLNVDKHDVNIPKDSSCEFINGVDQRTPVPPPPPPVNTGGGTSGQQPPAAPVDKTPVAAAPANTPAPVEATTVAPTVKAGACQTKYIGTEGDDRIDGSLDGDIEYGLGGNDFMNGQVGDDCLYGGLGADTLIGAEGLDLLSGDAGADKLFGGDGNDRLFGGAGNDRLYGNAGADRVSGGLGNDRVSGDAGNDAVYGGDGNDNLTGGSGDDTVSGGAGADTISGGPGSDILIGGRGKDVIRGDAGNDTIHARDGQKDVINCGSGRDSVIADKVDVLRNCEKVTRR